MPEARACKGGIVTAWWVGRTFYACPCGFQHETHIDKVPVPAETLPCLDCKTGTMRQWQPRRG